MSNAKHGNPHRHRKNPGKYFSRRRKKFRQYKETCALIRGLNNENLFESALKEKFKSPRWFRGWRRGLGHEDSHLSTDFIIYTDFENIRIDVKSSETGAFDKIKQLEKIQNAEDIVIIVVKAFMTCRQIREILFVSIYRHLRFKYGSNAVSF